MNTNTRELREAWIIEYLYDELDTEQKLRFEQELDKDRTLKTMYEEQLQLNGLFEKGSRPLVSQQRADQLRNQAIGKLQKPFAKPNFFDSLGAFFSDSTSVRAAFAGALFSFAAGVLLTPAIIPEIRGESGSATDLSPLNLTSYGEPQLVEARLDAYSADTEQVKFSYTMRSESQVSGNLDNSELRALLAQSLRLNDSDELRLQLVELFANHVDKPDVRSSLIQSLLNDPNPGVRYAAVSHLVKYTRYTDVKQALRNALKDDVNSGVRVESFLALSETIDQPFLKTVREHSVNDSNTFIRERSKQILNQYLTPMSMPRKSVSI